jgi:peptidoglycan/xylan/chitin deacetylase (PgdA/CDA1 family)
MSEFKSYNDFVNGEHKVTDSIGKIYGKRAKDTDGSLQSIEGSKSIYITFDYCPETDLKESVIDLLKEKKIPCTFFISTKSIDSDSEFENKIGGIDYSIGGHSFNHKTANEISNIEQKDEIEKNLAYLKDRFKSEIKYYRFPNGISTPYSLGILKEKQIKPVSWFNGVMDSRTRTYYELNVNGNVEKVKDKFDLLKPEMLPGKIFLFHLGDNGDRTVKYLRDFIEYCSNNKLKFAKL